MSISLGGVVKVRLSTREEAADYIHRLAEDVLSRKVNSFKGTIGIDGIDGQIEVVLPDDYVTVLSKAQKAPIKTTGPSPSLVDGVR